LRCACQHFPWRPCIETTAEALPFRISQADHKQNLTYGKVEV
jgi:hypothetical protein